MSVSLSALVQRCRRQLQDEPWEDALTAAVTTAGQATVTVANPGSWVEGDRMEFDDETGDMARVKSTANGANTVPIKRSHNDSGAATHLTGTTILKNPHYERNDIVDAINEAVGSVWPDGYIVATGTIAPVSGTRWYDAPTDAVALIRVAQMTTGSALEFVEYGKKKSGLPVAFTAFHPTLVYALGFVKFNNLTNNLFVTHAKKVTNATVEDGTMAKFVVMDACRRLLEAEDVERGQQDVRQGDTGTPVGSAVRTAAWFMSQSEKARRDMALQLKRDNPLMRQWGE